MNLRQIDFFMTYWKFEPYWSKMDSVPKDGTKIIVKDAAGNPKAIYFKDGKWNNCNYSVKQLKNIFKFIPHIVFRRHLFKKGSDVIGDYVGWIAIPLCKKIKVLKDMEAYEWHPFYNNNPIFLQKGKSYTVSYKLGDNLMKGGLAIVEDEDALKAQLIYEPSSN